MPSLNRHEVATQVVFEIDEDTPACTPWNAVLRPGASATCDQLVDHCSAQLARFESPKITFIEVLPRNPSGKVLKRALKEKL